jgi:hypothetical protein
MSSREFAFWKKAVSIIKYFNPQRKSYLKHALEMGDEVQAQLVVEVRSDQVGARYSGMVSTSGTLRFTDSKYVLRFPSSLPCIFVDVQ